MNKPESTPHPEIIILSENNRSKMVQQFKHMLETIGGNIIETPNFELVKAELVQSLARAEYTVNMIPEIGVVNSEVDIFSDAVALSSLNRVYLKSSLGVAENGSVWLSEMDMVNRLLPFICQHLVVVLEMTSIVSNMHEAYKKINGTEEGYHVFLAGPSKTADIEQSLVIGAHGARTLLVYLIAN